MSYSNYPVEDSTERKPRVGKSLYLFLLILAIGLGLFTFFGERLGLGDYIGDAGDLLAVVEEVLFNEEPFLVGNGNDIPNGGNPGGEEPATGGSAGDGSGIDRSWYQIYFTQPTCPDEGERHGGLEEILAVDIAEANVQVDVAIFDLEAEPLVNALIELEQRDVIVRIVTDSDYADQPAIRRLRRNGISVVEDKRRALMHNKFVVIDKRLVWTGSMNFTENGIYCNNNNFVRFESDKLAANYTAEMDEMYIRRSFGPESTNATPHEEIGIGGVTVENYFAPEKKLVNNIARAVARAQDEILFMAFSFTNEDIGEAMLGRAEAGVTLHGIFEGFGASGQSSYYPIMSESDIPSLDVRLDANPNIMHHKVIIVDRRTVVFGSFNFTGSANRQNDENVVIVHDPAFASAFVQEFDRRWAETSDDEGFWNSLFGE